MKTPPSTFFEILSRLRPDFLGTGTARYDAAEEPFRSELYSSDQMEEHGGVVARSHRLLKNSPRDQLLKRLDDNEASLLGVKRVLVDSLRSGTNITPAAEWLLDNFFLIEEQILIARKHLSKRYSEGLPSVADRFGVGMPRVYDIVLEIIAHSDGRIDLVSLGRYITSYQNVTELTLGELWAIPIMLRLAVIENLRRVSRKVSLHMIDHNLAVYWAAKMTEAVKQVSGDLILTVAELAHSKPALSGAFVAEFQRELQGKGPVLALPLSWVEQQLARQETTTHEIIRQENHRLASRQASVRNSVGTLRLLGATEWRDFVEEHSRVEKILRADPSGIYPQMDFSTRDQYRHAVEALSKATLQPEPVVARKVLNLAAIPPPGAASKQCHVGYYLIDKGLEQARVALGQQPSFWTLVMRGLKAHPLTLYLSLVGLFSFASVLLLAPLAWSEGARGLPWLLLLGSLTAVSVQCSIAIVNWLAALWVKPQVLPRMDFSQTIPPAFRTMVVVPCMLSSTVEVERLIEALEIRFLANRGEHLHFGLLTDFVDADTQTCLEDSSVLALAEAGVTALNREYGADSPPFFLFHRSRTWNPRENKWMGWERKRGKLSALNAYLRGRGEGAFSLVVGSSAEMRQTRYVVTLDADTMLPPQSVWKLVSTLAHPLNQAVYDSDKKRVTEGYGILQPRVTTGIAKRSATLYSRLQDPGLGIDPYTRASSDLYQDLFGEGSFIGKGIYDVEIFEKALGGIFSENQILSHDLLEGCFARSGLVTDVILYEDGPADYAADIKRRSRWVRGDWQIGTWAFRPNRLSGVSRWKIFDNLRRSQVPLAQLCLLILGWTFLEQPWVWTLAVLGFLMIPALMNAVGALVAKPSELDLAAHWAEVFFSLRDELGRLGFALAVLPNEVRMLTQAAAVTLWRLLVTRNKLLQWVPSATSSVPGSGLLQSYGALSAGPILAVALSVLALASGTLLPALPLLILWLAAPSLSWRLGLRVREKVPDLTGDQTLYLHRAARKTWAFFETYMTDEDHWLPPDNVQEQPRPDVAHRTSPTNMGLALLATLAAYDFGYLTAEGLLNRCRRTLESMAVLERHKGHFFNWYDTKKQVPLKPRYVSAVDSGNLIGHLLTLRQGLLAFPREPVVSAVLFSGLRTTLLLLRENWEDGPPCLDEMLPICAPAFPMDTRAEFLIPLRSLLKLSAELPEVSEGQNPETHFWRARWTDQLEQWNAEIERLPEGLVPTLETWAISENAAQLRLETLARLVGLCEDFSTVEYGFLYNKATRLLRIGYNLDEQRKDTGHYDLLASEARLGVFAAIAQGQLPHESWFALGRQLTSLGGDPILLSWSGSMFEYLMPLLIMPDYRHTLLHQTGHATVRWQIEYGDQRGIPWGISESAYNRIDANLIFQYRAFGVPGLGMKRGLEEDLVVAPYATMLALLVSPTKACQNLERMTKLGFEGVFGHYEAIDFTPSRLPRGKSHFVVPVFMAHHLGMSFLSLASTLLGEPMQKRFEAEPRFQAVLLLLQERIPRISRFLNRVVDNGETFPKEEISVPAPVGAETPIPEVQLLGNGRYQVMVTNSGGGYSRWKDLALTRWREDTAMDNRGTFCYIKDLATGKFWSNTHQPTLNPAAVYEARFSQGHMEFRRVDEKIETKTEVAVSPEHDVEIRRIRMTNRSQSVRSIELTSYAEVVLAPQASDEAHPAFSNLFVQTEIVPESHTIFCTRRRRSEAETPPWMFHLLDIEGVEADSVSYETDRSRFVGRSRSLVHPLAMDVPELSGSQGAVLDPIVSIRVRFRLKPHQSVQVDMIYGAGDTRGLCEELVKKYRDGPIKSRALELSWTHTQLLLRQINAADSDARLFDRIAASLIFVNPDLRTDSAVILNNSKTQSGLWSHSISGDLPIVLLQVQTAESLELVRQLIQAHTYWSLKGLAVDLVIWNEDLGGYRQTLQEGIQGLVSAEFSGIGPMSRLGSIVARPIEQISSEDRVLFRSVARVVLDERGTLLEQVGRHRNVILPPFLETKRDFEIPVVSRTLPHGLLFSNGIGGFTPDGREYQLLVSPGHPTPAPWVNVLANPDFGTVVSESGSAYTWAANAHEYRLTPWANDPLSDAGGEAFYLRDEESGFFWSPCPYPKPGTSTYLVTHGFGYSTFEHQDREIETEMTVFVDAELPVKFVVVKIRNRSNRERSLSVTGFADMVLGDLRSKTTLHVVSDRDAATGALLLRNRYSTEFSERVVFFRASGVDQSFTADRTEFVGRNRNLGDPQALQRSSLSGAHGAGMEPCAAIQVKVGLRAGAERTVVFQMGSGENLDVTRALITKLSEPDSAFKALRGVKDFWNSALGVLQTTTPDPALNLLANGWLLYQTLAARIFARSGFYQSGGAFGFRDQLQDVLAVLPVRPELARRQILLSASRQFVEGDVQHWWHPPGGRGVRTRCSDDLLWLPYVVVSYLKVTEDPLLLQTPVAYLEGREIPQGSNSLYDLPAVGPLGTVYEHCVRAIERCLRFGTHGLPLMGSGDWNDGMDQVGPQGRGESVWLGFFLYSVLVPFAEVARASEDLAFAQVCVQNATRLQESLETAGWDGKWYLRAFFDSGEVLGSNANHECSIDAISQSWSVLSGAAPEGRRRQAMDSLQALLVRRELGLVQLLDPPFDGAGPNPGYIQGYVPGVRENGGQYSHAAVWALQALAVLKDRRGVWDLFSMIQPIGHSADRASAEVYKVEPYVMAADVYANPSHPGRGGWTWYTGSAGWMVQFVYGSLLGLKLRGPVVSFSPCFPIEWPSITVTLRRDSTSYTFVVFQTSEPASWSLESGRRTEGSCICLVDDGGLHDVEVHVGETGL